ncbi:hypothetical protein GN958_ATG01683 [Phytophthora infestans]|uniref:Uncharacterized protein n=1 Tax=Phytophthora infestans TaxID=4787 RepID=A0A8S9VCT1_PHYIN|nr:hypothetical protein GN958_ATG01683 [Phytophthora infestans]
MRANSVAISRFLELGKKKQTPRGGPKRYLEQPEALAVFLDITIHFLREEFETLQQRRQHLRSLAHQSQPSHDVWRTVTEYFRLIRHGLHFTSNQVEYIRGMTAPNVVFNAEYGPEAIMQHWFFVKWFGDVHVELKGWEMVDGESIIAVTTTSVTITQHTLRSVFPHLRTTDNSDRNRRLAEQLLNQRLAMRGSTCFDWDGATGLVTRMTTQSDMLAPMLQLLGSMKDVSLVFEQALISPEFQWKRMLYQSVFPLRPSSAKYSPLLSFIKEGAGSELGHSS